MSTEHDETVSEQALAIGRALAALRERAKISQDTASAEAGVTRQAWSNYETKGKPILLRTDMQEKLATAIGLTRADLLRERDRQAGVPSQPATYIAEGGAKIYELPVVGRIRTNDTGPQLYGVEDQPSDFVDLAWMFGPNARTLRMPGDSMTGYVEGGQLVVYDVSIWPRRGDGCVVELQNGDVHVAEYAETAQGVLKVRQRLPEETLTFPMSTVKGAYAIRFRGG